MEKGQEWSTGKLLSVSSYYWRSSTVHAGVKLDLFTEIGNERLTSADLSNKMGASQRGVEMLLNALTALGLLIHNNHRYQNTDFSKTHLVKGTPGYIGYIIAHHYHRVDAWTKLDEAVIQGAPVEKRQYGEDIERQSFQMGMFNLAMAIAPSLASEINLDGRKHLLDLGGGPGTHAIHFCLANPDLQATVFDRATTAPFFRETTRKFGMDKRMDFMAGDFNVDPIAGSYDVVWLSQILHSNTFEECQALIEKTVSILEPGGMILIHDFFLNDTMDGPLFPALFSLNMLLSNHGRSYSEREVREMMSKAGVQSITRLDFCAPNDSAVLSGTV
jgi:ubiquinone/menaquinone biosynthesis C-methylase UbiE